MSLASERAPSPLVLALAEVIRSAVRNTNLVVDHAIASGEAVLVPCDCVVDIGQERCVCRLGLPLPDRWIRAARNRRAARRPVGLLPHRTCILCRADNHDLAPTYEVAISVVGHGSMAPVRVASPRRRSTKVAAARASRAGAWPPEAVEAQKAAAGVR